MKNLSPFVEPNREFIFNAAVMLVIMQHLSVTKTGKKIMTLDRLQIFHFLALRPKILASVIAVSGKTIALEEADLFQVPQENPTADLFISLRKLKSIVIYMGALKLLKLEYSDKDGFIFELTEHGIAHETNLNDNYYNRIRGYADALTTLQSVSVPQLNERIKYAAQKS